ncbi:DJ-1/PfpI family protein [Corynebacterium sp. Marseille-P4321]|uniref:DJ-1/PfpI family protein n=1 Tax=Corynebacterium sp. Marseille-P4321 TaxID=2736603 RepID=UPI00158EABE0|nr:DJ-1/PfpI family protein [Corynebacterium sp. Marseille-P4321]
MALPLPQKISIVIFDDVELLDVAGPVEIFSKVPGLAIEMLSPTGLPVTSSQGVSFGADADYGAISGDTLLIPGGQGTRQLVYDEAFLAALKHTAENVETVMSVCTGSALLAAAGLLEGYAATSNKRALDWATSFGTDIEWQRSARWVHDRDRWTSSGVTAGIDMTAAFVATRWSSEMALDIADSIELRLNLDSHDDPFAS